MLPYLQDGSYLSAGESIIMNINMIIEIALEPNRMTLYSA